MTTEDGSSPDATRPAQSAEPVGPERLGPADAPAPAGAPAPAAGPVEPGSTPPPVPTPRRGTRSTGRRAKPRRSFLRELPGIVVTALVISVLIKTFLVQAFYIPSGSMENTLLVNDRVLVNKLADQPDEIHRGDVIVFRDPGGWLSGPGLQAQDTGITGAIRKALVFVGLAPATGEEDLIKRVIGVGGDHVVGKDGKVSVNGVTLTEPYVYPGDQATTSNFDVTVPKGDLWMMGDHRSVSEDSRAHQELPTKGFVPVRDVIGRAFTIVWPLDRTTVLHRPATFGQPGLAAHGG